jgi:hypothetical protein
MASPQPQRTAPRVAPRVAPRPPRPQIAGPRKGKSTSSVGRLDSAASTPQRGRKATGPKAPSHTPTLGPGETRGWLVLKEGYLHKTKWTSSRVVRMKSTKLRYFVLKQNPDTLIARLEYVNTLFLVVDTRICVRGSSVCLHFMRSALTPSALGRYYEGLILKGALELVDAEILLEGPGRFVIIIDEREVCQQPPLPYMC